MWDDEQGIDTLPLKLVVYLILVGVIIAIAAIGLKNAGPQMDEALMQRQMGELKSSFQQMQSGYARDLVDPYAPTGNVRNFDMELPDSLEYICFGVDPDPDNNGILTDTPPGLETDDGNVIYYKLTGGSKTLVKLDSSIHLREGVFSGGLWAPNVVDGLQQALVIRGGSQSVTFELAYDRGDVYTLSHLTDDVDAYIKPDNTGGLPNGLLVSVQPDSVPADGVMAARVSVQVIDSMGTNVQVEGRVINLSSSRGNQSTGQIITNSHGSGSTTITSGELGLCVITARSPGLHNGSGEVAFTLPPVALGFNDWILSSPEGGPDDELYVDFKIKHDTIYSVTFTGWGTEAHLPLMSEEWAICRIEIDGMIVGDKEIISASKIDVPFGNVLLGAGNHTLRLTMKNDFNVPLLGDRNLYVATIMLS
jgi:type II secretory pathway pseudopilin PulG